MKLSFRDRERITLAVLSCNVYDLSEVLNDLGLHHKLVTAFITRRGAGPTIIRFPDWEAQVYDEHTLGRPCPPTWMIWEGGHHAHIISPQDMAAKILSAVEECIKDKEEDKPVPQCPQEYRDVIYDYVHNAENVEEAIGVLENELTAIKVALGVGT